MVDEFKDFGSEPEPGGVVEGLSWVTCIGAATGLVVGVVTVMLISASLHWWMPESQSAEVFWEIAAPLLGVVGVIVGSVFFRRYLDHRIWLAVILFVCLLALGLYLAIDLVGFPWRLEDVI